MAADPKWEPGGSKSTRKKLKKAIKYAPKAKIEDKSKSQTAHRATALACAERLWGEWVRDEVAQYDSAEKTVCVMFFVGTGGKLFYSRAVSSYPKDIKGTVNTVRKIAGVDLGKKSVCAEEHLIAHADGDDKFLFSYAYDQHGKKKACGGCAKILATYKIIDLVT